MDKSCGRVADKFGLRTWTINLRTWIFGFTCLVFKATYIDRGKPLREGAFPFTGTALFPPLDKRNTRDKAKSLRIASERCIGELGVRCLSTPNRGQDSRQQSQVARRTELRARRRGRLMRSADFASSESEPPRGRYSLSFVLTWECDMGDRVVLILSISHTEVAGKEGASAHH